MKKCTSDPRREEVEGYFYFPGKWQQMTAVLMVVIRYLIDSARNINSALDSAPEEE
jgi:hypothetical protein